eukprot:CAMPEP_0174236172 /NCGR_PEP_ID=MMETSP0417-20130205/5380_1 /TAXON_ID=242541 /ORGANISM="Mayorella sp, Strain BSH-02190019" /LENGTH=606 /DNA_ID=CAMNT_0015314773 /DNA_START=29 /DNA_END=1846 /DNA_ORIENTATION=-
MAAASGYRSLLNQALPAARLATTAAGVGLDANYARLLPSASSVRGLRSATVPPKELVIVGGVAGGASAAARARRLSEHTHITIFDKGPDVSIGTCGMPYKLGGEITSRDDLLVVKPTTLQEWFNLDIRTNTEVMSINRAEKEITVKALIDETVSKVKYDKLILATGAKPVRPPIPGIDLDHVYTLRTLQDLDKVERFLSSTSRNVRHATIVGAGFIGLELAENLHRRGLKVTIVERADQVLLNMDKEMTKPIRVALEENGVELRLDNALESISEAEGDRLEIKTSTGPFTTDLVFMSIGVRPDSELASAAGLDVSSRGAVRVNEHMQTSDPDIYAVGDTIEVDDFVPREKSYVPLAGPANRQGRVAADHCFGCGEARYRGTQGSAITRVFNVVAALTGSSEKTLDRLNWRYSKLYVHPNNHAGYYPGAATVHLKVLFDPFTGRIFGAQGVGPKEGVDKRIDVLATAIQSRMTVFDLEELECCYAPPFNSAKDPNNFAGFVGAGLIRGEQHQVYVEQLDRMVDTHKAVVLDVREPEEFEAGAVTGAINIPLGQIRERIDEIPADRPVITYCRQGMRGYVAKVILRNHGRLAYNLAGGYITAYHFDLV